MKYYLTDEQVRTLDKIASEMSGKRAKRLSPMEIQDMGEAIFGIIEHEAAEENEVVILSLVELERIKHEVVTMRKALEEVLKRIEQIEGASC